MMTMRNMNMNKTQSANESQSVRKEYFSIFNVYHCLSIQSF